MPPASARTVEGCHRESTATGRNGLPTMSRSRWVWTNSGDSSSLCAAPANHRAATITSWVSAAVRSVALAAYLTAFIAAAILLLRSPDSARLYRDHFLDHTCSAS